MWLINAIQNGDTTTLIVGLSVRLLIIFLILPIHEWAHGFVAYKLGDYTAKNSGRLTLNPLAHIDYFGSLCLIVFGFGWAKPVPVNGFFFKHRKRDLALTAIAGPVSNLIMAVIGCIIFNIIILCFPNITNVVSYYFLYFISTYININIMLAVFNLLPIPPLDGSRILSGILPDKLVAKMFQYERYITIGLFVLLWIGVLDPIINFLTGHVGNGIIWLADLPFKLLGLM